MAVFGIGAPRGPHIFTLLQYLREWHRKQEFWPDTVCGSKKGYQNFYESQSEHTNLPFVVWSKLELLQIRKNRGGS
uniref:Uncharacterized protein n=1 Tax=Marseillevirus sp. TaxID=2809551 RepID=A0AA96EL68_9VIRU|nr:hypothetical protein MarFTMF_141 [Marseillevirus sp.]